MLSEQRAALELRHRELVARSGALREKLGLEVQVLVKPMALADRVRAGGQWLAARPVLAAALAAVFVVMRPRRTIKWVLRLWSGWRLVRSLKLLLAR